MNRNIKISCPDCLAILINHGSRLYCPKCSNFFPIIEGIPSFSQVNPLFEGRFTDHVKNFKYRKNWAYSIVEKVDIRKRRIAFLRKCLKDFNKNSLILDIGCGGGGWGLFLKRYGYVIGMDISIGSLKFAKNIYEDLVHASVSSIPFPSNYFDAVVRL